MKTAKINQVVAIEIICMDETCKGLCVSNTGSYMITNDDQTVTCELCGTEYKVPSFSKRVVTSKQKKVVL